MTHDEFPDTPLTGDEIERLRVGLRDEYGPHADGKIFAAAIDNPRVGRQLLSQLQEFADAELEVTSRPKDPPVPLARPAARRGPTYEYDPNSPAAVSVDAAAERHGIS